MINEFRRARRRKASDTILVVDAMTERVVGRIGNLSETGMLLMAGAPLVVGVVNREREATPETPGLEPGQIVLIDGHHYLGHDTRIRLVDNVAVESARPGA